MADVEIRRCTLRVVRRGGWSWGTDPQALLAAAVKALPALIAARLARLWPEGAEHEIAAPVRLRIPIRLEELLSVAAGTEGGKAYDPASSNALGQRIEQALGGLASRDTGQVVEQKAAERSDTTALRTPEPSLETLWGGTVLTVLLGWQRQGRLRSYLLAFSLAAIEAWHASIVNMGHTPSAIGVEPGTVDLAALMAELDADALPLVAGRRATLVKRLLFLVEAVSRYRLAPGDARVSAALDRFCPFHHAEAREAASLSRSRDAEGVLAALPGSSREVNESEAGTAALPRPPVAASPKARIEFEVRIPSALPFLLLGPLSRTGYLQALTAAFEAAGLLADLPAFATALARKVLDPPGRGWHRRPDLVIAAAAFSGLEEPIPDPRLAALAREIAPHLSPLDAVVANVLTEGHRKGYGLVLQRADLGSDAGLLLCDEEGVFPIAWANRIQRLFSVLADLGGELLLVPQSVASAETLGNLDQAGFRFVTDAPPGRGEDWRALTGGALRAWSNDRSGPAGPLLRAREKLEFCAQESETLWRALVTDRPALPSGCGNQIERSLALASALALGTIAWTLWQSREPATPLLALERFADLDARVRFARDRVQVRLPMGRRFSDLEGHGLLADVANVPWLGGRVVQFSAG